MRHRTITALLLGLALAAGAVEARPDAEGAPADKALNQLYWQAQEELKKSDWNAALAHFVELEKSMRSKDPKNADTALYWQAYTLVQAKRTVEARTTTERLHREFPQSRWGKDADALVRQVTVNPGKHADNDDEDLAEMAVEGLMNAPPERAMPLLRKVLAGNYTVRVKKRALFVLSQLDAENALDQLIDVARNNPAPELRDEAIQMLGVSGADRAIERLRDLYQASNDTKVKRKILQAFLVADRKDLVLASARGEPDADLRRAAVDTLGAMGAGAELKQLFDANKDPETRSAIVQALGVAGEVDALAAIAGGNEPEEIRVRALHALGIAGDHGSRKLVELYPRATTPALRNATLQGLLVSGDQEAVAKLYKQAKTAEEKRAILKTLTVMGGDEALEIIEAELDK